MTGIGGMEMGGITASPATLMRQAPDTAGLYLGKVVECVDREFGEGYAKKNPELVAKMIEACARDFETAIFRQGLDEFTETMGYISSRLGDVAESISEIAFTIGKK